jgi:hypothetical protein
MEHTRELGSTIIVEHRICTGYAWGLVSIAIG